MLMRFFTWFERILTVLSIGVAGVTIAYTLQTFNPQPRASLDDIITENMTPHQRLNRPFDYDVIVIGSEPEGVAAAVAAAQEGSSVLLMTEYSRIGGLFVTGMMNSLDLPVQPLLQRGLFEDWWNRVGRGFSFDVRRAEAAFGAMLREAGVDVRLAEQNIRPITLMTETGLTHVVAVASDTPNPDGPAWTNPTTATELRARHYIDATADADITAAVGVPYTMGFESLGLDARMVDTLVFQIDGVDWQELRRGVQRRGRDYAEANAQAAWGHFGRYPQNYEPLEHGVRLRGLNLGLQEDGTVLVNALLIYNIDPFDPESIRLGFERAEREAPRIIDYLKLDVPGFANASYGGVAETLYIRETRHMETQCQLTGDDVLANRVTEWDIAAGSYPLDVQTLTPQDNGFVFGVPDVYGAQLCVTVPVGTDNLWVIGRAAGYDPVAASSARVVPFGMNVAEAVGLAAAKSSQLGATPASFASNSQAIELLRRDLRERGAYLAEVRDRNPVGPYRHDFFEAFRVLRARGLAVGGYDNDPKLDVEMTASSYLYLLSNVARRFLASDELGPTLIARHYNGSGREPLSGDIALAITSDAACYLGECDLTDWSTLAARGFAPERFVPDGVLTRGETYALAAEIMLYRERNALATEAASD